MWDNGQQPVCFLETNKTKLDFEKQEMIVCTAKGDCSIIFLSKTSGTPTHLRTIQTKYIRTTLATPVELYTSGDELHNYRTRNINIDLLLQQI